MTQGQSLETKPAGGPSRPAVTGSDHDPALDAISRQAAALYHAPKAFVTLSDGERLQFCGVAGVARDALPDEAVFCAFTVEQDEPLVVPDATRDPRFADHPIVTGPPYIRFYAGMPVVQPDGRRVGTVCIVDTVPRDPPPADLHFLERQAARVTNLLWERSVTEKPDCFLID